MNDDVMKTQWKQIRGQAKEWWNKLSDDDLNMINGRRDRLISKLQEKYGYNQEQAAQQLDQHLGELQRSVQMSR